MTPLEGSELLNHNDKAGLSVSKTKPTAAGLFNFKIILSLILFIYYFVRVGIQVQTV